jgi:putative endonuclease
MTFWSRLTRPFTKGRAGERAAAYYLIEQGYTILERNWTCALGEIDIVALDGPVLCIVEVKRRLSARKSIPEEALTSRKRRKLAQLAEMYLRHRAGRDPKVRLDLVAVDDTGDKREIRLYKGI